MYEARLRIHHSRTMQRLKHHAVVLRAIPHLNKEQLKAVLKHSSVDFVKTICEISLNLLKGNIELSSDEKAKLKVYKKTLRQLAKPNQSVRQKRKLLVSSSKLISLLALLIKHHGL